ncbi:ATP-binding protein [Paenibacillus sp. IHBB 10380]|uniref:ATP-binding protein n=1 Tax=Paenibacillus sp. IHBB 10380 TaxID=1566358 RepID=UPI00069767BB|nr:ATP-binding protein [Paenibacillus sp. IHBB 10380]
MAKHNEYLINYDPLTGLYNYYGFITKVQQIIGMNRGFRLVLIDINNFRSVDFEEILVKCSLILQEHFPNHLAASRYAGGRFALILPGTERMDELQIFEKIGIQVTCSTTHFPEEGTTFQKLLLTAEDRIYNVRREYRLKRQEELLRSDKMKTLGELAAGMAHEIRNPLTSIQGFIQLSKKTGYNIQPWYDVIMEEIARVSELTVEFLQFSKPHETNIKNDILAICMARVYSLCESEATSYGHIIEMDISDQNIMVLMDRDKIIQVLINLVRNAIQAMKQAGYVHFVLSREGDRALIQICDNGKGIPTSEINKIFDPFYTTKEDGTGLGLSLCQKIIEDHHGHITVVSEVGVGTVFTVDLPIYHSSI